MNMNFKRKLPIPMDIKAEYPLTKELEEIKIKRDKEIRDIFEGKDDRFILIIGPCSADNDDSVIDYISRLRAVQDKVADKILIIPESTQINPVQQVTDTRVCFISLTPTREKIC